MKISRRFIFIGSLIAVTGLAFGWHHLHPKPSITITSNNSGSTTGGTLMIITGRGFSTRGVTHVWIGAHEASKVTVASSKTVIVSTPPGEEGAATVTVVNPDGQRASQNKAFTYSALKPVITMIEPSHGPVAGGFTVKLHGHAFLASAVRVQVHATVVSPAVADDSTLTFIAPPMTKPGQVNVVVKSADNFWSSDNVNLMYE